MKVEVKEAKAKVQRALMPGQVQGGSAEVNIGVSYEFPDAKVYIKYIREKLSFSLKWSLK